MRKQTKLVAALSATALLAVGASMTSFAKGWTEIGDGEYVYLDSDGERVTSEWRRSGADYFFLDENGEVAKSRLITPNDGDTDAYYYVNSVGARLKGEWARVINEENDTVNDQEPEMFWYYLGSNGKALRNDEDGDADFKKYSINYAGANRTFFFDTEGRMVTGWIEYTEKNGDVNLYYCDPDDPAGGYAVTGWKQLEVPDDWGEDGKEYDVVEWFYFDGGKAKKADEVGKPKVWYKDGWYYSFDKNGVMLDDWYTSHIATSNTTENMAGIATPTDAEAFTSYSGTKQGSGWIYTDKNDDGEYKYYYLVTYKDSNSDNKTRNVAFNSFANNDQMRAKSINGKVYLFDKKGAMKDGVVDLTGVGEAQSGTPDGNWGGATCKKLDPGTYYFNNGSTGVKGQMMTGKQSVVDDGETYHYYFDKNTGAAVTNAVIDGYLYGKDGKRVDADNGNANEIVTIPEDVEIRKGSSNTVTDTIPAGSEVIVTSNGKVKTSESGYTKVDGEQYKVIKSKDAPWKVITKEDYEKLTSKK